MGFLRRNAVLRHMGGVFFKIIVTWNILSWKGLAEIFCSLFA